MPDIVERDDKRWGMTLIPQCGAGKRALVLEGAFYGSCVALMVAAGYSISDCVEDADVVVFIGGVDVDPALYGQQKLPQTQSPSLARDKLEKAVYVEALKRGIPMFGICRGAQFLHVMNGGELWQHVEGHAGPDHLIYDTEDDLFVMATSYHHQMLALNANIDVLAVTKDQISKKFHSENMVIDLSREGGNADVEIEIEAGCYWETKCFFVQGHPEVGSAEYRSWAMTKFEEFVDELEAGGYVTGSTKDAESIIEQVEVWRVGADC